VPAKDAIDLNWRNSLGAIGAAGFEGQLPISLGPAVVEITVGRQRTHPSASRVMLNGQFAVDLGEHSCRKRLQWPYDTYEARGGTAFLFALATAASRKEIFASRV